jgi:selenocysteine lyase/cysteine desulfurase
MNPRRNFFKQMAIAMGTASLAGFSNKIMAQSLADGLLELNKIPIADALQAEDLWKYVQQAFTVSSNMVNLNNGGVSPQPKLVQDAEQRYLQLSNEAPSFYMWRILGKDIETLRMRLAKMAGCSPDEIALNRNTTEAMQTVLSGLDWKEGDEIVCTEQDYSTVKLGWEWLERRHKVKIVKLDLKLPFEDEDSYVKAFIAAFTAKTKLVNLTQIINWTGQVVPVAALRRICDEARKRCIFSLIDGAHAFAQLDFNIPDIGCDAFATSLHKWLCAPFGNGMLYVRKESIPQIWSLMPSTKTEDSDIRKFEHLGTRSFPAISAIGQAIDFHEMMGIQLKEARLRYLKDYWTKELKNRERIIFHSPHKAKFSCAIALVEVEGLTPAKVEEILFGKFQIHTVNIEIGNIKGTRITPHVYTKASDLDRLLEGFNYILKNH